MKHLRTLTKTILFSAFMLAFSCSSDSEQAENINASGPGEPEVSCFTIVTLANNDISRSVGDMACGLAANDDYDGDGVPNAYDGVESEFAGDNSSFAKQASDAYYEISNIYQLQAIMSFQGPVSLSERLNRNYRLVADIDASPTANASYDADFDGNPDTEGFLPIGDNSNAYTGTFEGDGHIVSNLYINRSASDHIALFAKTSSSAAIQNVGLENADINGNNFTGALVGENGGSVRDSYSTGAVAAIGDNTGGLVGRNLSTIKGSYSTATLSSAGENTGGLAGYNDSYPPGNISNSYASGTVSSSRNTVGGLLGHNNGLVQSSYASGNVEAPNSNEIGGLLGCNDGTIKNSYASGNVTGNYKVGGLVGYHGSLSIFNNYATGDISGDTDVGGLVGKSNANIRYSYTAAENVTGIVDAGAFLGKQGGLANFTGVNYYANGGGSNGIGDGSCGATLCIQSTSIQLMDSLDETLDAGLDWDAELDGDGNAVWGNLNAAGYPCLRNMPAGAPSCN